MLLSFEVGSSSIDSVLQVDGAAEGSDDDSGKAHVAEYKNKANVRSLTAFRALDSLPDKFYVKYPFEQDEEVWILKPEYRHAIGPFKIAKAHPNDMWELVSSSDNSTHPELVEGKHLRRDV